jgi:hypothetical protein
MPGASVSAWRLKVEGLRLLSRRACAPLVAVLLFLSGNARAASLGPAGYTNAFGTQPAAADWATLSVAGVSSDNYNTDTEVNAGITAGGVTAQTTSSTGNPPLALGTATWSSSGFYLQTRPTGNRYTVLMGKFVNNTGTNATQITLTYDLTIAGAAGAIEEAGKGTRAYYSLSGLANSWVNLPSLNHTISVNTFTPYLLQLALTWTNGGSLFFMWVDDNASGAGTDPANQFDNFSLRITAGSSLSLACALTAPTNDAAFVSGTSIEAMTTLASGTAPYTVEYFTNSGAGNTIFASAGASGTAPYNVSLGALPAGTYNIYAIATDSAASPANANSTTNTFLVADPIVLDLTAPVNDATFDNITEVVALATVAGGTAPFLVQFYLDNAPNGAAAASAPYERNLGALFVGDHTISATVSDARGWVSNSLAATIHITGPLGVSLTPTNGASYNFGQSVSLDAVGGGGTAPHTLSFYIDDQLVGLLDSPPFTTNLGLLPVGTYTSYVHIVDSSIPTPQQADSTTNIFTIRANPLAVNLTSPINDLTVTAGQPLALAATAAVGAPVTVSNVQFYFDGASVGVDGSAPYSASVANPMVGNHTVYAAATDSLGRRSYSDTNHVTVVSGAPGSNNQFTNAIPLNGLFVTTMGNNVGATREPGEPSHGGFGGTHSVWWTWIAPDNGLTTIDTFGSSFDTLLGVYVGIAVNQLTTIAANDDYFSGNFFSAQSLVQFRATAGTVYRIAVDGYGGSSGSITLHIQGPNGVSISSPSDGAVFTLGDPIPFTVNISSNFPSPPATRVDIYRTDIRVASSTNAPFTVVATDTPVGTNTFYAVVFGSTSQSYTSATVNVFVQNVGVTLLQPLDGSYWNFFGSTSPIPVTAWAYLPAGSGSITNIEFYVDGQYFGQDSTPPYNAAWSNPVGGSHRLTAIGRSDTRASYVSQPHFIAVYSTFLFDGSVWKYLDDGSNQGTNWIAPNFDDSGWASGPSPFGYGDSNGLFPATTNSYGPDPNNKYITTYYRHSLVITNVASYSDFYAYIQRDDGVVVYLNGAEIFRNNLPSGTITYTTRASAIASDDGGNYYFAYPSRTLFVEGTNVFAAEVHQNVANTPDSWFQLYLIGEPALIRNQSPLVAITSPTNNDYFLAPSNITLAASASDPEGNLAKVEFFSDGVKLGETTNAPYSLDWNSPPPGPHSLTAVATDDEGATQQSGVVHIDVYDAAGTPFVRITSPADGAAIEGGTNLFISAYANAPGGVTNLQFFANGSLIGEDATSPFSVVWDAPFGTNLLAGVAFSSTGFSATSAIVSLRVFPNTTAPTIVTQAPPRGATLTSLASLAVTFSERVQNVDAGDLLINGIAASGVSGSGSNYLFTFPQPREGQVRIAWANGHGITDFGYPSNLPFNELSPEAQWEYTLIDRTPPMIVARVPSAGSTVTNLAQISVTFSETVTNVDAADLLVNGTPALGLTGSGSNYIFSVAQPPMGTVSVAWASNQGIFDLAAAPNAFNGTNTNARWSFTLDLRVVLVQSNSNWRLFRGFSEASTPTNAWRQPGFNDSAWSNSPAPFFYGDPYNNEFAGITGTLLSDMQDNYTSIFLRREFVVERLGAIPNLLLNHQSDDGFVAWLNGVEVIRYNLPGGQLPYNATASSAVNEPNFTGAAYIVATLANNAVSRLLRGTNVLAVQAFNQSLSASSDFGFNAQLYYFPADPATIPPQLASADPPGGDLFYLTNVTIRFSEGVAGVDAGDLLVNGTAAIEVNSTTNTTYTFSFPQPGYGPVLLTWATNHGIADLDTPPRPFDGTAANSILSYTLINPSNPRIVSQIPLANTAITGLTSITVTFTEPVAGVEASDLLISGTPANAVASAEAVAYTFSFPQPPFGAVTVRWATNHGITDLEAPPNGFDPARFGGQWNYTLIDPAPNVVITSPTNNGYVLEPANIPFRATASDYDGTVSLVEFFVDAGKVGEATNTPYALTISNVLRGSYTLRAVATDNIGLRGTSAPTVINVVTSLPVAIVRGPYLNSGSATGGVVRWRTDLPSDAVVWHGPDLDSLTNLVFDATITNEHILTLTGLPPDTKWYYSFGTAAQTNGGGSNYWFKTAPVAGTRRPYRFWVLGDCGTAGVGLPDRQQSTRDAYYNFAATNRPADVWLMLGDNAYNSGTDAEYQRAVFDIYPDTLRNLFLWPVLGNHETAQSSTADNFPYLDIFSLPKDGEAGGVPSGTEKYYSFDYGNIHFIGLDSMTSGRTADTPMADWLRADLEAATAEWIIVFFHHPPYTKGNHDSDLEQDLVNIRENLVPILETNGVDLVLCGHSHAWERSYLLHGHYGFSSTLTDSMKIDGGDGRENGDGPYRKNAAGEGVVYTVAGNAGQVTGGSLNHPAHFISLNELGTMVLDVNENRLDVQFLRETGEIRDRFTIIKPAPIPSAPHNLLAVPTGPNEIRLFWTPGSSNHLGFTLEHSIDGVNFTEIFSLPAEANNALDSGLLSNTTYFYRARATNAFGRSDWSAVASASTVMPTSAPRAPAGLAASADDGLHFFRSRMVLTWQDRSTNEAAFQIERSSDGASFVPVTTVAANLNSFVDEGLESATLYYYRVRSLNALGLSTPSNLAGDQTHPQNQFARAGETVTFHAGPEGAAPLKYWWRFNSAAIPGATNETLILSNVQLSAEGEYSTVIRDAAGVFATKPAYLIVVAPPRIVAQPQDQYAVLSTTLSLAVVAEGTEPMTYHWRKDGAFLPGANSTSLLLPNVQGLDAGGYDLIAENDFGSATSRVAAVTVYTLPSLQPVPEIHAEVLRPLTVSNFVHDANQPPLLLSFSLAPEAPTNAHIHALTGRFSWTPSRAQAPSTNSFTVRAVDPTRTILSNSMTFTVIVNDYFELTAGSSVLVAGTNSVAPIDCFSSAPLLGVQTVLQVPGARLTDLSVEVLAPELATAALLTPDSNTASITFTATPGNTLQGTQRLAQLRFTAAPGQSSVFVPLHVDSVIPTRADPGPAPTVLANHGRAVILGTQPLIDARLNHGVREIFVYGRVGLTYQLQYTTNLANPIWTLRSQATFTNLFRSFLPGNTPPTNRSSFFRARQL